MAVFNPNEHLMQLKSKQGSQDYLPVQWRLVWFREQYPQGTIDTEEIVVDDREVSVEVFVWNNEKRRSEKVMKTAKGYARFKATVTDGKGGRATGHKSENAASFDDYVEKAETGAIGRALAALGYGTQFAPELDEQHRIVDAPVDRSDDQANPQQARPTPPVERPQPPQAAQPVKDPLQALRHRFWKAYAIKPENYAAKWLAFKEKIIGLPVEDSALADDELARLQQAIEAHETTAGGGR